jgi:hypothetical protein
MKPPDYVWQAAVVLAIVLLLPSILSRLAKCAYAVAALLTLAGFFALGHGLVDFVPAGPEPTPLPRYAAAASPHPGAVSEAAPAWLPPVRGHVSLAAGAGCLVVALGVVVYKVNSGRQSD